MDQPPPAIPPEQLALLASEDHGPRTIGIVVAFTVLAFLSVILRFVTRTRLTHLVGWEDYLIALAMAFSIATSACQVKQVGWGAGKHQVFVDLPSTINSLRYLYSSILTYVLGFIFVKLSILMQYRRIFSVNEARIPIYIVMAISVITGIIAFFTFAFECKPVDAFWNVTKRPTARCLDENAIRYGNSSTNAITDIMIAALPIRGIWRLQIVRRQKIALIFVLTLGWFVCIVSILRFNALVVLARHPRDMSFYSAPAIYWNAIEINLAIVCACVPTLKPLVVQIIPVFASRGSENSSGRKSGSLKWSKLARQFRRLDGNDVAVARSTDVEQGSMGSELKSITALPPMQREPSSKVAIRVTHDIQQQSS
ncbi:hypothetical protein HBI56_117970 [Parastagonospora nodorum]|uniref:Rhodopsin domain-containing protein n=2 Tax=Phaeosphaeria nodorum (strain SN15 / ATCC MYA-4574 / FGSC 10173) TaxID=321614 RepID=A0A7U2I5K1_PHANO|nr:hypothetical protein SNOG_05449 [Parastagonospora nodorum SN15]KAH3917431.1 hypothetical protein HBH56_056800 [Parastagonospora nodorum]EAT87840.1 hypothetical protein SNOG_05449 [Parastagonospora nodorum SN15]KAH3921079.1 hypothetical protein HBH54_245450 [Parastagonospora nodorum]KAH3948679.1 hypothetical protein HBH53_096710 [Parastagonospora nodorum]KAH3988699.1 hypothetical protein HBH52_031200 [Parastagonospora nodorum]